MNQQWVTNANSCPKPIKYTITALQQVFHQYSDARTQALEQLSSYCLFELGSSLDVAFGLLIYDIPQASWPQDIKDAARAYGLTKFEGKDLVEKFMHDNDIEKLPDAPPQLRGYSILMTIHKLMDKLKKIYVDKARQAVDVAYTNFGLKKDSPEGRYVNAVVDGFSGEWNTEILEIGSSKSWKAGKRLCTRV